MPPLSDIASPFAVQMRQGGLAGAAGQLVVKGIYGLLCGTKLQESWVVMAAKQRCCQQVIGTTCGRPIVASQE
jgi:hypothetical protein